MRWVEKHPRRPRQENLEFEASLSDTVRHCLKKLLSQKKRKEKDQAWWHTFNSSRQIAVNTYSLMYIVNFRSARAT